jgi:periplasmic divalent cation tolerance protein
VTHKANEASDSHSHQGQAAREGDELLIVMTTFSTVEAACEVLPQFVSQNLAACINILPQMRSIYRWKGEVTNTTEVLCLIKTRRACHAMLLERLAELHTYVVPEMVTLPVSAVNEPYLRWVLEETSDPEGR